MKSILITIFFLGIFCSAINGQNVPTKFSYQALLRQHNGIPLSNETLILKVEILNTLQSSSSLYTEIHEVTSNEHGQISIEIGSGEVYDSTSLIDINWIEGPKFLRTSLVDEDFNLVIEIATTELISVPYSLVAQEAIIERDGDSTNELQQLSLNGNELSISQGNSVFLSEMISDDSSPFEHENNLIYPNSSFQNADFILGAQNLDWYNGSLNRLVFNNSKGSLMGGLVFSSTNWDQDSIGRWTFNYGNDNKTYGDYSFSMGVYNRIYAQQGFGFGSSNVVSGYQSGAFGSSNSIDESYAYSIGTGNYLPFTQSMAFGQGLISSNGFEYLLGRYNEEYDAIGDGFAGATNPLNRLLTIGNGTLQTRSNSLVILNNGNTGIGENNPETKLHVNGSIRFEDKLYKSGQEWLGEQELTINGTQLSLTNGGNVDLSIFNQALNFENNVLSISNGNAIDFNNFTTGAWILENDTLKTLKNVLVPGLDVKNVHISNGSDIAEFFDGQDELMPGDVVSITENGTITKAQRKGDKMVIGVISGANGLNVGLALTQKEISEGDYPVAIAGQVYVKVIGKVKRGDLLIASEKEGYAESAENPEKFIGSVIGKAISNSENGYVRMIVSLK